MGSIAAKTAAPKGHLHIIKWVIDSRLLLGGGTFTLTVRTDDDPYVAFARAHGWTGK